MRGIAIPIALVAATVLAGCGGPAPRAFVGEPPPAPVRVAVLPLANFSGDRDAPDRLLPMILVELARRPGIEVEDPGRVEEALAREPWLLTDRIPPDLADTLGVELGVQSLLVGSVLEYGTEERAGERIPQVSLSLRLMEIPGGRIWWSANHSRDGEDSETVFGMGKVTSLERLASDLVARMLATIPNVRSNGRSPGQDRVEDKE